MIDYSHNPSYAPNGVTTPTVSRCTCGHVLEFHYKLLMSQQRGSMVPAFRHASADRCPSSACDCTTPQWDGEKPAKLPNLVATRSDQAAPAA